ncbi:MAG TPA: hypothetical protein DEP82_14935 [Arthrobacter bacterium]|jgi:hypothetical protein|nr:hypothetical protein [Arthrobacter sp.]
MSATIHKLKRSAGVAGQFAYDVSGERDGEPFTLGFVSSVYGGPIVMVQSSGAQVFVTSPERFGPVLNPDWVRKFLNA